MPNYYNPNTKIEADQRRKYAEMLMQQSQQPQGTEVVGGYAVPQSPLSALARAVAGGIGSYQEGKANQLDLEQQQQKQAMMADAIKRLGGGDSEGAAGILAQSPETSDTAFKMYADALDNKTRLAVEDRKYERELMRDERKYQNALDVAMVRTRGDSAKAPNGYRYNDTGNLEAIPGGPGDKTSQPMNEYQGKSALFADRAINSDNIINRIGSVGTDPAQAVKSSIPLVGNYLVSDDYQQYDQAKRDFLNAILRQESGAAIGKNEFDNANKQYFPQPGDSEETIKQKSLNRKIASTRLAKLAGPAYNAMESQADLPSDNAPQPLAIPPQGQLIGTSGGKKVYRLPNGTHVMEQ